MRLDLAYGDSTLPLEVPESNLVGVLAPPDSRPFHDTGAALAATARECCRFVAGHPRVLVLVNDYTRPTPNQTVLDALEPALADSEVRYIVCTGTHRAPTEPEMVRIFGRVRYAAIRGQVRTHDCDNRSQQFFCGRTRFGTDVWLARDIIWADRIITINSIEPHYFAGYTGGRKGFLPGIAARATIAANHNMVTHPASMPFGLEGNPVHEDMTEAARMVPRPVFSVQLVQDRNHRLLSVRFGDLFESFEAACADAHRVYALPVREKADIIISVLQPPYDINFYQSQRAVEFARPALKSPSVQVTVSACRDGVGNDGFIKAFAGCAAPADILAPARAESLSSFGWHKSARLAQVMQSARLFTVMGVNDDAVRSAFMTPYRTAQDALDAALAALGPDSRTYVIPDAGSVVPVLS